MPRLSIVAAVITNSAGRLLTVRKRGTTTFMLPGGKREPGESDQAALARELDEEIGAAVLGAPTLIGHYEAEAANEPDTRVEAAVYRATVDGTPMPCAEIAEIAWLDPAHPPADGLAPLLRHHVLPHLIGDTHR